jgi:hypothetical protein
LTDVDGAVKELVRILLEKGMLSEEDLGNIRRRYRSARTVSSKDPI